MKVEIEILDDGDAVYRDEHGRPVDPASPEIAYWHLTPGTFERLDLLFGPFDLDAAANETDHQCDRWLGPGGELLDATREKWPPFRRALLNPPFGLERRFVAAARRALAEVEGAERVVALLHARRFHSVDGVPLTLELERDDGQRMPWPVRVCVLGPSAD